MLLIEGCDRGPRRSVRERGAVTGGSADSRRRTDDWWEDSTRATPTRILRRARGERALRIVNRASPTRGDRTTLRSAPFSRRGPALDHTSAVAEPHDVRVLTHPLLGATDETALNLDGTASPSMAGACAGPSHLQATPHRHGRTRPHQTSAAGRLLVTFQSSCVRLAVTVMVTCRWTVRDAQPLGIVQSALPLDRRRSTYHRQLPSDTHGIGWASGAT
jgi:hypothetical protein